MSLSDAFQPTDSGYQQGVGWTSLPGFHYLVETAPANVAVAPAFAGQQQYYGQFKLGEGAPFTYVLDVLSSSRVFLYVDLNRNLDLSDDGAPIRSQDTGFFAAAVEFPM